MTIKPLVERLLMKAGRSILLVRPPEGYVGELGEFPGGVEISTGTTGPVDLIQVFVRSRLELEEELPRLKPLLKPGGLLWVTYYKGTARVKTDINRDSINAYAQTLGLIGVAMISIDEDWSALRLKRMG